MDLATDCIMASMPYDIEAIGQSVDTSIESIEAIVPSVRPVVHKAVKPLYSAI